MAEGLSLREFARRDGCDEKVVRRKLSSGHLKAFPDGSIDPALVGSGWRKGTRTPVGSMGVSATDVRSQVEPDETPEETADRIVNVEGRALFSKSEAERIKENYLALLRQLEYDRESTSVAEIDDVVDAVVGEYALVRNKLLNIGSRIAPRAAVMRSAEEVKALIDAEVAIALEELTLDGKGHGSTNELRRSVQGRFKKAS